MKKIGIFFENIQSETAKSICVAIVIIALFASGNLIGSITNINFVEVTTTNENAIVVELTSSSETATTAAAETTTSLSDYVADTDTLTTFAIDDTASSDSTSGAPSTTEEILAYFNDSANAVKASATSVTRNYSLLSQDPSRLSVPSIAESIAEPILNKFVVDDTEVITYTTTEEIVANFPIGGESGTVNVTSNDVSSATIQDNGTTYTVVLNFNDCSNPISGSQTGSAFSIVKMEDVTAAVSVLQSCTLDYYDCSITATIDKTTGNLIEVDYYMPIVYNATVSVLITTVEASVGIISDTNYTIAY